MVCSEVDSNDRVMTAVELNNRGLEKYRSVDFDDAIADYTEAIHLNPTFAVAYFNRGTVLYRVGELFAAITDLKKAVHFHPENEEFRQGLIECNRLIDCMR